MEGGWQRGLEPAAGQQTARGAADGEIRKIYE